MSDGPSPPVLPSLDAILFVVVPDTLALTCVVGTALPKLGYPPERWRDDKQQLYATLPGDERERFLAMLRQVAADGQQRQLDHRVVTAAGETREFRSQVFFVPGPVPRLFGLAVDASEVGRTFAALGTAESRLRHVVGNTPIVLMALDRRGVFTLAEGSGLKSLGLTPETTVGVNLFEAWAGEPDILANVRHALDGHAFVAVDRVHALGSWWETHWTPLLDADGKPAGATGVALDITRRKRALDASAEAMSLLRATLEATADGILVVDNTGRIVDYNSRFAEMWRLAPAVLESRDDTRALAAAVAELRDPDAFLARVRALYADRDAVSHDTIELRDGRIFERDSRPQRVDGLAVGRVWSFRDVTAERRAARRATFLADASKLLGGPLDDETPLEVVARLSIPYLGDWSNIFLVEPDGSVRSVASCHVDPSQNELLRQLHPDMTKTDRGVARVLTHGEPVVYNGITDAQLAAGASPSSPLSLTERAQIDILRRLGLRGYLCVPLRVRGQTFGAITFSTLDPARRFDDDDVATAMDLAQRAALALENQRLYRASKEAIVLRDEFLSVASHELRTPVTSLLLAVQSALSIGDEAPPGFLRHALASAERQSRRLARLVDTLLDVSRVQSGRLELTREPVDLVALAHDVVRLLAADARRANCAVTVAAHAPSVVGQWDRARLEQVVTNLVGNALKYGAGRPVHVSVEEAGERARLVVRDEGIGIEPGEHARIFDRFERAVSPRNYGGLGLGLYIVRRIVEAHGGTVTVESEPGQGSRFVVELPRQ